MLEMLNVEAHRALHVRPANGEGRHFVQIVPDEAARLATRVPLLFTKHPDTGRFYLGALFGFTPGENLLLNAAGGLDMVVPLDWEREGFFADGEAIAIDPDHPRLRGGEGRRLFDDSGEPTEALRRVQRAMAGLHKGLAETEGFVAVLLERRLIEPIDVSLSFDDGERVRLDGLYTVSRDALGDLPDADVVRLYRAGQLQLALTISDSLHQLSMLARRRNDRLLAA
jgi:hypothetical protein